MRDEDGLLIPVYWPNGNELLKDPYYKKHLGRVGGIVCQEEEKMSDIAFLVHEVVPQLLDVLPSSHPSHNKTASDIAAALRQMQAKLPSERGSNNSMTKNDVLSFLRDMEVR